MSVLSTKQRVQVVSCLVEGNSVRSTSRLTGIAKGSILKLLVEMGEVCAAYHDKHVWRLHSKRIQADEIWTFCGKKQKNVVEGDETDSLGSIWTWTALDPDSKLMVSYLAGEQDGGIRASLPRRLGFQNIDQVSTHDGRELYLP